VGKLGSQECGCPVGRFSGSGIASLKKTLQSSGFEISAFYFGLRGTRQPKVLVDHGVRRAKVFVIAKQA